MTDEERREKRNDYDRKYRKENKDEIAERRRKYHQENKYKLAEKMRKYHQEKRQENDFAITLQMINFAKDYA
jgi:hypothetical protein